MEMVRSLCQQSLYGISGSAIFPYLSYGHCRPALSVHAGVAVIIHLHNNVARRGLWVVIAPPDSCARRQT